MSMKLQVQGPDGIRSFDLCESGPAVVAGREGDITLHCSERRISREHVSFRNSGGVVQMDVVSDKLGVTTSKGKFGPGKENVNLAPGDTVTLGAYVIEVLQDGSSVLPIVLPPLSEFRIPQGQTPSTGSFCKGTSEAGVSVGRQETDEPSEGVEENIRALEVALAGDEKEGLTEGIEGGSPVSGEPESGYGLLVVEEHPTVPVSGEVHGLPSKVPGRLPLDLEKLLEAKAAPPPPPLPAQGPTSAPAPEPKPVDATPTPTPTGFHAAAFAEGLGIALPDAMSPDDWRHIGSTLRQMTEALQQMMLDRAAFKSELRALSKTQLYVSENNPYKARLPLEELLQVLLFQSAASGAYMHPEDAIREAVDDLRAHSLGIIAATRESVTGTVREFSPEQLKRHLSTSRAARLIEFMEHGQLWKSYVEYYGHKSEHMSDWLEALFERHFVEAYSREAQRLSLHIALP
jgi:type VI secretion system FHA domain protein